MPIAACDHCRHLFVIPDPRSPQRVCPYCLHPMRLAGLEEVRQYHSQQVSTPPPAQPPPNGPSPRCWDGTPLLSTEMGRRVLQVLADAAATRQEAQELRRAARCERERWAEARRQSRLPKK